MARNKNCDLRDHLFEVLEGLKDKESPMDVDRAKAICEVAQTIINSAKVDVDLARALGGGIAVQNQFFGVQPESRELPPARKDRQLS